MQQVDVAVIGIGPAGSSAAIAAARKGVKVIAIDRRTTIGEPVQCGEIVPLGFAHERTIPHELIVSRLRTMKTVFPSGRTITTHAPGVMLDRSRFDRWLAEEAVRAGAVVCAGVRATGIDGHRIDCVGRFGHFSLNARFIIGADGPRSLTARAIGLDPLRCLRTAQCRVPLKKMSDAAEFMFRDAWRGGYAWLFPKQGFANVGIGVPDGDPAPLLTDLLAELAASERIDPGAMAWMGGLVPIERRENPIHAHILLVGDAAGQTHPITGGGIPQAVIAGEAAGAAAGQAAQTNTPEALLEYPRAFDARFGTELRRAAARRIELDAAQEALESTLERCWVACRGYYGHAGSRPDDV